MCAVRRGITAGGAPRGDPPRERRGWGGETVTGEREGAAHARGAPPLPAAAPGRAVTRCSSLLYSSLPTPAVL